MSLTTHLNDAPDKPGATWYAACHQQNPGGRLLVTRNPAQVTCQRCRKIIDTRNFRAAQQAALERSHLSHHDRELLGMALRTLGDVDRHSDMPEGERMGLESTLEDLRSLLERAR